MDGPATATALAATLGTNTGATSYHLRKLAAVGLVEETGEGRGRERWWRAATEMHGWTERDVADDPDGRAASDWLRRHYLRGVRRAIRDVARTARRLAARLAGCRRRERLRRCTVSPARLAAFNDECLGAVRTLSRCTPRPTTRDDESVEVHLHAIPLASRRPMTPLDARSARRRYLILVGLRWLPDGLLIPIIVLLALSRGLSLTEIGLVFAIQGLVVLALELPTGGLSDSLGRRPVLILASLVGLVSLGLLYVADSVALFVAAMASRASSARSTAARSRRGTSTRRWPPSPRPRSSMVSSRGSAVLSLAIALGALLSGALVALDPFECDPDPRCCRCWSPWGSASSTSLAIVAADARGPASA